MQILLLGAGTVTSRLNLSISEQEHSIAAQLAAITPQHLELFDFKAIVVVAPECSLNTETLVKAAEKGKLLFIISGEKDGLAAWANSVGVPAFAYPPSDVDVNNLLEELRRASDGSIAADDQYRRAVLGSDIAARMQSGMAIRKIVVTSPKGGTGKTTLAVNLATTFALCGITTYLVDADANAGALQYHLRLDRVNSTLIGLLRTEIQRSRNVMGLIAAGANYLQAFTPLENLPTLKVLPGLVTDDLGDEILQNEQRVADVISGLFDVGVAGGGVVIMDVGINPAHVVHRAALRAAEGIAIVIKPEIPDLAETRRWISRMITSLSSTVGRQAAFEYVGSRVKLCYNLVVGNGFKGVHHMLQEALKEEKINLALIPNGVIPIVDPGIATDAVNSERREDILIWRYKKEHCEELEPFVEALIGFATHFVPSIREGAMRVGLLPGAKKGKGLFGGRRK